MKNTAWLVSLAAPTLWLLLSLLFGPAIFLLPLRGDEPVYVQDFPPPTELPARPGYRTAWAGPVSPANAIRRGDQLLEVVTAASTPFARHYAEPLYQAAFMARRCRAAVIVTLDDAESSGSLTFVDGGYGRVDEVIFDHAEVPLTAGARLWVAAHHGTRVSHAGSVQVVQRLSYVRAPRAGGRYLLFLGARGSRGSLSTEMDYGNAFEIRGRGIVSMTVPDAGSWHQPSSLERVRAVVRRRAALPAPGLNEFESKEDLLR